jgi:transcriptional regulator GlxA family with amidase domain
MADLAALAQSCRYCATTLAYTGQVSLRQLERYFLTRYGFTPHQWLRDLRLRRAVELIRDQTPLKVVAIKLGYKDAAHFTHDFKAYFGVCPSSLSRNPILSTHASSNIAPGQAVSNAAFLGTIERTLRTPIPY